MVNEPLADLCYDIQRLARKSYPHFPVHIRDKMAIDHFIDALVDEKMAWNVTIARPHTLQIAFEAALIYETFCNSRQKCEPAPFMQKLSVARPTGNVITNTPL